MGLKLLHLTCKFSVCTQKAPAFAGGAFFLFWSSTYLENTRLKKERREDLELALSFVSFLLSFTTLLYTVLH